MPAPADRAARPRVRGLARLLGVLLGVLLLALASVAPTRALPAQAAASGAATDPASARLPVPRPADLGPADFRWVLRTLDDRVVQLEAFRGQVLFVNLWATWCPPCTEELASIQALADSLAGEPGVAFLAVSPERRGPVERFVARRGLTVPVYLEGTRMPGAYGLRALPTTFVIDRQGRIVLAHRGAAHWDTARMRAFLRELAR